MKESGSSIYMLTQDKGLLHLLIWEVTSWRRNRTWGWERRERTIISWWPPWTRCSWSHWNSSGEEVARISELTVSRSEMGLYPTTPPRHGGELPRGTPSSLSGVPCAWVKRTFTMSQKTQTLEVTRCSLQRDCPPGKSVPPPTTAKTRGSRQGAGNKSGLLQQVSFLLRALKLQLIFRISLLMTHSALPLLSGPQLIWVWPGRVSQAKNAVKRGHGERGSGIIWIQSPALPLINSVTLVRLFHFPVPQYSPLQNR